MKKSLLNIIGLLVIAFGFISCRDDAKDPWTGLRTPTGATVLLNEVLVPVLDVSDIANASYQATLVDPVGNVSSYAMRVNMNDGDFFDLRTITSFPHNLVVTSAEIAAAIGVDVTALTAGTKIGFSNTVMRNDGTVFTSDNLAGDVNNPGQRQGFTFTTFVSCPFSGTEAAGNYNIVTDGFGSTVGGGGTGIVATATGSDNTQVTFANVFNHPNPATGARDYNMVVDVDPASGEATIAPQETWHCDNFGCPYGVGSVRTAGSGNFFFSCTGFLTVNLNYTVALGSFGTFKLEMQKQ